jgi:hypothetical protein
MSADDAFNAAVAIAREVVDERKRAENLYNAIRRKLVIHATPQFALLFPSEQADIVNAASEFAAPYLQRIAELEAKNRALCDAARLFADEYEKAKEVTMPVDAHTAAMSLISILPHEHKFARCGSDIGGTHLERCACGKVRPIDTGAK